MKEKGRGWKPDMPDWRDHDLTTKAVKVLLEKKKAKIAKEVDLSEHCSPVEDQGSLGSCTAHAGTSLLEFHQKLMYNQHIEHSRLFLYKVTRFLDKDIGDTGAQLRTTMKALTVFGCPPEMYWPYKTTEGWDIDPDNACYAFAQRYRALKYFRVDAPGLTPAQQLEAIKTHLSSGFALMFGFSCYSSLDRDEVGETGKVPFPNKGENGKGGHAILAVGYSDSIQIVNGGVTTTGALKFQNSWGKAWGDKGFGWLPYDYILRGAADDFWGLTSTEWLDVSEFNSF